MRRVLRPPRLRYFNTSLQALVRELPAHALLPFALAIALLFSVLGPATDMLREARQPAGVVVLNSILAATIAVGFGFGSMRRNVWLLAFAGLVQFAWLFGNARLIAKLTPIPLEAVPERLKQDAETILLAIVGSYSCFLWFMNGTAARYLRVRAEMDLARQIHDGLVPTIDTTIAGFAFYGVSTPSGEVGGDLVDVVTMDADGWFGYVADVSGHGVSSGVVMGMFKSALRMRLRHGGTLASLLADLNAVLLPLKSSSMFVTVACIRAGANGLEYAVAGHLPILRVRADDGTVDEITTPQIPIGMFEAYDYISAALRCERGDLLALITDGLTEVFDANDQELGMDAVKQLLSDASALPLSAIADRLVAKAHAHGAQIDDQTLLLIRVL
jgi:hypothetical protein